MANPFVSIESAQTGSLQNLTVGRQFDATIGNHDFGATRRKR
jgi:hypothetical protein